MAKRSYTQIDAEIIASLDIQAEYAAMGVRFAGGPRQSGKISCHAVGREDNHPSAWVDLRTGRYGDSGGGVADASGVPRSLSLWDFAATFGGRPDWQTARREFARTAGVKIGRGKPPENWRDRLEFQSWDAPGNLALVQRWCLRKRGITIEAIRAAGGQRDAKEKTGPVFTGTDIHQECFRPLEIKLFEPSRRIEHSEIYHQDPFDPDHKDKQTVLLFHEEFARQLIDFGYADARARHDELATFFDRDRPASQTGF